MTFLDLPVTTRPKNLLLPRKTLGEGEVSISRGDVWRKNASFVEVVEPIQRFCKPSLEKLRLRVFASQEELRDLRDKAEETHSTRSSTVCDALLPCHRTLAEISGMVLQNKPQFDSSHYPRSVQSYPRRAEGEIP
ncbi:hypothetical protein C7M84_013850 [Penaeus vannamei]|uniref:Uncharacterized protein n=1 Tax=Penaeus vannamei TaxID=6689 RepID=A0A3R7M5Z6_PENVA|nr:hypothetical protein C7M84_013850 [Penaeus vannamei]